MLLLKWLLHRLVYIKTCKNCKKKNYRLVPITIVLAHTKRSHVLANPVAQIINRPTEVQVKAHYIPSILFRRKCTRLWIIRSAVQCYSSALEAVI